jgi:hypothetical protein
MQLGEVALTDPTDIAVFGVSYGAAFVTDAFFLKGWAESSEFAAAVAVFSLGVLYAVRVFRVWREERRERRRYLE